MATIKADYAEGKHSDASSGNDSDPPLATVLRDVADDLAAVAGAAAGDALTATVGAALPAFTDPPSAAEMGVLRTRVNEIRTAVLELQANYTAQVAAAGADLKTVKG